MDEIDIISGADDIARLAPLWAEAGEGVAIGAFEQIDLVRGAAVLAEERGAEPFLVVVRKAGRAMTLLPLRRERFYGARAAVPLVQPLAQYSDVVGLPLEPRHMKRICDLLSGRGIDLLLLRKVRADGGLHAALSAHGSSQRASERAPYIDLQAYASFAAYDATFSSTTRRNRRQRRQKLEAAAGPLSFEVLRGAEADAAFEVAAGWKRQWLAERGIASPVFDSGPWEALLASTVAAGSAIVTCLKADAVPVAVEVGFAAGASYIAYLGAFDPRLGAHSPGQEQMLRTIAWCFEQGFERYDLLAPADSYKRQWARGEAAVSVDDYAIALTQVGWGVAEVRRHVRPLARDIYRRLSPEVRVAGGRYGMPAAAAAAAMCAGLMMAGLE